MKITKQRLKEIIKEEIAAEGKRTDMSMPALSPEDFVGAGIEDFPDEPAEDDTRDRAFASPRERLFILMNAREALSKMTSDELAELSLSLDAPMLATLQHILGNPMYAPIKESDDDARDLIRKAEFEKSKGRLHQGDVDRIKDRLAKGERVHAIKRDYPRNF